MLSNKMPFIFARIVPGKKVCRENITSYVVIVSEPVFEYGFDPIEEYRNLLLIPENTLEDKRAEQEFPTLDEAQSFVKEWWKARKEVTASPN